MDKARLQMQVGKIQRAAEAVMFPVDDLWGLTAEENINPTIYGESELEAIDRGLSATADLTKLLQELKRELENEQKAD